ncbi:hypothetical protein [Falsiroseomonas ponticola]|jgi:hypothetical protein|uniref:hypothetical protein n=1 Tax=Falsiroseomonas ponticola TaxID=2786951 RepID=UPI0019338E12|nr:hypothetical protein [Roseomonas ponticola]
MDKARKPVGNPSEAVIQLAGRLGIAPEHFSNAAARREPETFGLQALLDKTTIIDPFLVPEIEGVADIEALREEIRQHYARSVKAVGWANGIAAIHDSFFAGTQPMIQSPLDGKALRLKAELFGSRLRWGQWLVLDHQPLRVLVLESNAPIGIWYPDKPCFLLLREAVPSAAFDLRQLIASILKRPAEFLQWLDAASRPGAPRAFILAEARPAHFMGQSLGFIDRELEQTVLPFLAQGNMIVTLTDRAFVDPLRAFPQLRQFAHMTMRIEEAPGMLRRLGVHCRLNDRRLSHTSFAWAERLRGDVDSSGIFGVWISVDAERMRYENQVEGLSACLRRLAEAARARGQALKVLWDGWTVPAGLMPTPNDRAVIDRITQIAAEIRENCGVSFTEERLYGRSVEDKIALSGGCRLAIATYGTATILPSQVLDVPTVTYQIAEILTEEDMRSGRNLNIANAFPVPTEFVVTVFAEPQKVHLRRFRMETPALLETLERAIAAVPPVAVPPAA